MTPLYVCPVAFVVVLVIKDTIAILRRTQGVHAREQDNRSLWKCT